MILLQWCAQARFHTTRELLTHADQVEARVELARRFNLPIASCALLLLGIALGLGHPRFQKGGSIVKSLAVILVYYLLLKYFENQLLYAHSQRLAPMLGLYALPWLFLGSGFALLRRKLQPHHHPGDRVEAPPKNCRTTASPPRARAMCPAPPTSVGIM